MAIFIVTGPSGAGKTSIAQEMQDRELWQECVSHTTRLMRKDQGEKEGVTYYYISEETFRNKLENGEFAEHVEYNGNNYGVSHAEIKRVLGNGRHVFIIVENDGHNQIKELYPEAISIFLYMSKEDCLMNMLQRGDKADKAISRIELYDEEISNKGHYDYVIKNVYGKREEVISVLSCIVVQYN
jgi:guanylate kinase